MRKHRMPRKQKRDEHQNISQSDAHSQHFGEGRRIGLGEWRHGRKRKRGDHD